jgi:hypothetical protein
LLSLVTASVAATWVQTEERRVEHEILRDLRAIRDELATLRSAKSPERQSDSGTQCR